MLHSQQILGTKPFDANWGQATSQLERELSKVMRKKQNHKQDDDSDGIVQLHLAVDNHDNGNVNSHKSTAKVDTVGELSTSLATGGNNEWENPDKEDAST